MLLTLLLALAVGGWAEPSFPTNGSAPFAHRAGGVGVIVEPRLHPQLLHVIRNFAARLPADWRLHLVHGSRNAGLADTLAAELGDRLALTNLGVPDLAPKDTAYNQLLASPGFWATVAEATPSATHALVFQTDTCLCGGGPPVAEFLAYDYVGAPWGPLARAAFASPNRAGPALPPLPVGNGGLSLRRVSAMLALASRHPWDGATPEDVWFSALLQQQQQQQQQQDQANASANSESASLLALLAPPDPTHRGSSDGGVEPASTPRLVVGGASVSLEALGPVIVNADGTTRRIANWEAMDNREQAVAWRRIKARNAKRIQHLQAAADADSGSGDRGSEESSGSGGAEPSSPPAKPSPFGRLGVAPLPVALRFALESAVPANWRGGRDADGPRTAAPFGVHAPQRYLTGARFAALAAACPDFLPLLAHYRSADDANRTAHAQAATPAARTSGTALPGPALAGPRVAGQSLGWVARCSLAGANVPCAAAVYGAADDPLADARPQTAGVAAGIAAGMAGMVAVPAGARSATSAAASGLGWGCSSDAYAPLAAKVAGLGGAAAAVAARGGCSFRQKAQAAQRAGFSALVVVLGGGQLMPPDLGPCANEGPETSAFSCAVRIPVVAVALAPAGLLAPAAPGLDPRAASLHVALEDGDLAALRGTTHGVDTRGPGHAPPDTSGLWALVQSLQTQAPSACATGEGRGDDAAAEGLRRRDATVGAAAAAAGRLTPLTRQGLRERIGDAVVDCEEGCPRSVVRLARAAAKLPAFAVVSVPPACLAAFVASVLPRLRAPIVLHTGDPVSDLSTGADDASAALLRHSKVAHWFADSWAGAPHPKSTALPLGFSNAPGAGSSGDLRPLFQLPTTATTTTAPASDQEPPAQPPRPRHGVLANFHHSGASYSWAAPSGGGPPGERLEALHSLAHLAAACPSNHASHGRAPHAAAFCVLFDRPRRPAEAWALRRRREWPAGNDEYMPAHVPGGGAGGDAGWSLGFEACPAGNGPDTHRVWEALALGLVPLVQAAPAVAALHAPGTFPELLVLRAGGWSNASALEALLSSPEAAAALTQLQAPGGRARNLLRLSVEWWAEAVRDQVEHLRAEATLVGAVEALDRPWGPQPPCQPPVI